MSITHILFALLVMAFSRALHRGFAGRALTRTGPLLVGYFGVTQGVLGLARCTPGCAAGTPTDLLHGLAATTGLLAVAIGMLSYWRATHADAGRSLHSTLSGWSGALTLGLLIAWLGAAGVDQQRLSAGVLQRSLIAVVLTWLAATAVHLRGPTRPTSRDHPRPHRTSPRAWLSSRCARSGTHGD